MARTVKEIKEEMGRMWMSDERVARAYGFEAGAEGFGERFGVASVENLLMYVWAVCAWAVEKLMDELRADVNDMIDAGAAHRSRWYKERALEFMDGYGIDEETGRYDTSGLAEEDMEAALVVKYAAATEDPVTGILTLKVAGADGEGNPEPLEKDVQERFNHYIGRIKDAGVRFKVVSRPGDRMRIKVGIEYNPLLREESVRDECEDAISGYLSGLPFNGEYSNMGLVDALQRVNGVMIVGRLSAVLEDGSEVESRVRPAAGYFTADNIEITLTAYEG